MFANIAEYVTIECRIPTLFVSLEMGKLEVAQRLLASLGSIDANKFRSLILSGDDHKKMVEVSNKLSRAPLFVDDTPTRKLTEIAAVARRLKRKENLGLLIIDYLQLVEPDDPRDQRQEQVAKMARRLKGIARELKIPVLCLAQLNRQAEPGRETFRWKPSDDSKAETPGGYSQNDLENLAPSRFRPRLAHLRESGAIEQDADVVMFIHRQEVYQTPQEAQASNTKGRAMLIIAKQRNGPIGDVPLLWFDKFTCFKNMARETHAEFDGYETADAAEPF